MSKNSNESLKGKIIGWLLYGTVYLIFPCSFLFVGYIVWDVFDFEKWVFPKTYWSKEIDKIQDSIRTKEAFLVFEMKRLNSQKTQTMKNQDFNEDIEILRTIYKSQGKNEEETDKAILKEREKQNRMEAALDIAFEKAEKKVAEAKREGIDKQKRMLAEDRLKLEFAKMQLVKHQGK